MQQSGCADTANEASLSNLSLSTVLCKKSPG